MARDDRPGVTSSTVSTPATIPLHVERLRAGRARRGDPRVVLVHGFTQNTRCWSPFDRHLDGIGAVDAVDLPGHGRSPPPDTDLSAVGAALAALGPAEVHVGYSLGGRVLLHAALVGETPVRALVLIGAHPGLEDAADRARRRSEDGARADRLERIGVAAFLDEWLRLPLFGDLDDEAAHRVQRLSNTAAGLAASLRRHGTGAQEPLWERLHRIGQPTLVLAGARDQRFTDLGRRTAAAIGSNATFAPVAGTSHACHLEDPRTTAAVITEWMASI